MDYRKYYNHRSTFTSYPFPIQKRQEKLAKTQYRPQGKRTAAHTNTRECGTHSFAQQPTDPKRSRHRNIGTFEREYSAIVAKMPGTGRGH